MVRSDSESLVALLCWLPETNSNMRVVLLALLSCAMAVAAFEAPVPNNGSIVLKTGASISCFPLDHTQDPGAPTYTLIWGTSPDNSLITIGLQLKASSLVLLSVLMTALLSRTATPTAGCKLECAGFQRRKSLCHSGIGFGAVASNHTMWPADIVICQWSGSTLHVLDTKSKEHGTPPQDTTSACSVASSAHF